VSTIKFLTLEHLRVILGTAAAIAKSPSRRGAGWLPAAITSSVPRRTGGEVGRWDDNAEARRLDTDARRALDAGDRLGAASILSKLLELQRGAGR
jgi:hypothetical protein